MNIEYLDKFRKIRNVHEIAYLLKADCNNDKELFFRMNEKFYKEKSEIDSYIDIIIFLNDENLKEKFLNDYKQFIIDYVDLEVSMIDFDYLKSKYNELKDDLNNKNYYVIRTDYLENVLSFYDIEIPYLLNIIEDKRRVFLK